MTAPDLQASYERCRRLHARFGRTYYLATWLLPAGKRPGVHALYGFARYTDEILDSGEATSTEREQRLADWRRTVEEWPARPDPSGLLPALHDTLRRWEIPPEHLRTFFASMAMDLTVTEYKTYGDLLRYTDGSAAAIGRQLLPILGHPGRPRHVVEPYAADLGVAFQLTNFIRDVGEDLRRGRLYLPLEDLDAFEVTREQLEAGVVDGRVRRLLAFEVARTREVFRSAAPGVRLLDPASRDCVGTAFVLYRRILDEVERAGYRVLDRRVAVSPAARAAVAAPALARALAARRRAASPARRAPAR